MKHLNVRLLSSIAGAMLICRLLAPGVAEAAAWSVVSSLNPSASENVLDGAAADPSSGQAWAVGEFFNNTTSSDQTLTEFNP